MDRLPEHIENQTAGIDDHATKESEATQRWHEVGGPARRVRVGTIVVEFPKRPSPSLEKRRAREALVNFSGTPMDPLAAVGYVLKAHAELAQGIDRVRVVQPSRAEDGLRILQTWTKNQARLRQLLYEAAPAITLATGWYPLVTGAFRWTLTGPAAAIARQAQRNVIELDLRLGEPLELQDLTHGRARDLGNSFLLKCKYSAILLDLGFQSAMEPARAPAGLIFLSHAHADHAGGLIRRLRGVDSIPILLTELTLSQLVRQMWRRGAIGLARGLASRAVVVDVGRPLTTKDGAILEFFHANHSPGAVMMCATWPNGRTFLYTGDLALANAYSQVGADAVRGTAPVSLPRSLDWALIDAVMLKRADVRQAEDAFTSAVNGAVSRRRHLIVLVDHADVAVRLYLQIYGAAMQGASKRRALKVYIDRETEGIVVDLQRLARMHAGRSWLSRRVDPGVARWWDQGKGLFEAHQLFSIDENVEENVRFNLGAGDLVIVLLAPAEVAAASEALSKALKLIGRDADVVVVGGRHPDLGVEFLRRQHLLRAGAQFVSVRGEVTVLDGLLWGLHSHEADLEKWLTGKLGQKVNRALLFHAPKTVIQRVKWLPPNSRAIADATVLTDP
jgi:glyoxylase-like metal-dependent hydrolase (beta-lactamase superfamily II)